MRSYLGFDAKPVQVIGAVGKYELASHWARLSDSTGPRTETQEHGIVQFEDGRLGIFHWTNLGYDTPLRWWRSSRFLAEKGMGITVGVGLDVEERLSTLAPGGEGPALHARGAALGTGGRRRAGGDGGAYGRPGAADRALGESVPGRDAGPRTEWNDDEIGVAGCILSLVNAVRDGGEPTYGAQQARLDQEIIVALRQSAAAGGAPLALPLDPAAQTV